MDERDELQARRLEEARDERPAALVDELLALFVAMKPIIDRLERDIAARP